MTVLYRRARVCGTRPAEDGLLRIEREPCDTRAEAYSFPFLRWRCLAPVRLASWTPCAVEASWDYGISGRPGMGARMVAARSFTGPLGTTAVISNITTVTAQRPHAQQQQFTQQKTPLRTHSRGSGRSVAAAAQQHSRHIHSATRHRHSFTATATTSARRSTSNVADCRGVHWRTSTRSSTRRDASTPATRRAAPLALASLRHQHTSCHALGAHIAHSTAHIMMQHACLSYPAPACAAEAVWPLGDLGALACMPRDEPGQSA